MLKVFPTPKLALLYAVETLMSSVPSVSALGFVPLFVSVPTVLLAPIVSVPAASICAVPVVPEKPWVALIVPLIALTRPLLVNGTVATSAPPLLAAKMPLLVTEGAVSVRLPYPAVLLALIVPPLTKFTRSITPTPWIVLSTLVRVLLLSPRKALPPPPAAIVTVPPPFNVTLLAIMSFPSALPPPVSWIVP